jgi:hypothetical protein
LTRRRNPRPPALAPEPEPAAPPEANRLPVLLLSLVGAVVAILLGWNLIRTGHSPTTGLHIISATYSTGVHVAEVTDRVNDLLCSNAVFYAHPDSLGTDPSPGWNKQLTIIYEYQGHHHLFTTGEGGTVSADILRSSAQP